MRKRFGGNAHCPCNSGFKFKNCCGKSAPPMPKFLDLPRDLKGEAATWRAKQQQQQHGQLVPSKIYEGQRRRTVGRQIYNRPPTETFHDFLMEFAIGTVGNGWYKGQLSLPPAQRHQIVRWFVSAADRAERFHDERFRDKGGDTYTVPASGDQLSLLHFGYDLLHLQHRGALPHPLVERLKNRAEFQGALYEIAIAATFVRAGLEIEFIDEKSKKHPEFFARDPETDARVAVEAKSRRRSGALHEGGEVDETKALRGDVENLVNEAFGQAPGDCPFMIFVDVNVPPVPGIRFHERAWFQDVWDAVKALPPTAEKLDDYNIIAFTTFTFLWEGAKPASPVESPLAIISKQPRYPLPEAVMDRIVAAILNYGHIPREV
jgi:hypothetical protein